MEQADGDMPEMTPAQRKLFELRMKVNAGRKANKQEVAAEHERVNNRDNKAKKEQRFKQREEKKQLAASGKAHLEETAEEASAKAKKQESKDKKRAAFGWDVFNQDSLYKGYKKRLVHLPGATVASEISSEAVPTSTAVATTSALDDVLSYGKNDHADEDNVERMAAELEQRIKDRKKFSRRRQHHEGEDVDYINKQNAQFNKKAAHAYDKYTVEIRQNLERGTAL